MKFGLGSAGIVLTIVYLVVVLLLLGEKIFAQGSLDLNEIGDFVAGVVGPLALGWLVLGFFQQGKELRNSVKVLQLQTEELKNSVEQQAALVEVAQLQLTQEKEILSLQVEREAASNLPILSVSDADGTRSTFGNSSRVLCLKNGGAPITDVYLQGLKGAKISSDNKIGLLANGDSFRFQIQHEAGVNSPSSFLWGHTIEIDFKTSSGQSYKQSFSGNGISNGPYRSSGLPKAI